MCCEYQSDLNLPRLGRLSEVSLDTLSILTHSSLVEYLQHIVYSVALAHIVTLFV